MIIYNNYNRECFQPQAASSKLAPEKAIFVATNWELSRTWYFRRMAIATRALDLPRREIPNWMADVIFGHQGPILWQDGRVFKISDTAIDDAFGNDDSFRWLSSFVQFSFDNPPRQKPQNRIYKRLRLLDLAFQIAYPGRLNRSDVPVGRAYGMLM